MVYTDKIQRAVRFCIKTHELHQKQKRKGKDVPYIVHPLSVGVILAAAGACEDAITAGILHDTIEDSVEDKKVTRQDLEDRFGFIVADIVESVTETEKNLPWEQRKEEAYEDIQGYSYESVLVKSADLISNVTDLLWDYHQSGDKVWSLFNAPKEKLVEHWTKVAAALLKRWPESPLADDLRTIQNRLAGMEEASKDSRD